MNKEQLLSFDHNELYIGELGINIENNGNITLIKNIKDLENENIVINFCNNEMIYKHFNYEIIDDNNFLDTNNTDIELMKESVIKIKEYEKKIDELQTMISKEKNKIRNTNYVNIRLSKNIIGINDYINYVNLRLKKLI